MADRPILFSAPMVRALLDGRKTQTRRLCAWANNPNSPPLSYIVACDEPGWFGDEEGDVQFQVPYAVGDRLWVRETCRAEELSRPPQVRPANTRERQLLKRTEVIEIDDLDGVDGVRYMADAHWQRIENSFDAGEAWSKMFHYRGRGKGQIGNTVTAIHMPRWASRLTLTVTDVRVERLQDCSADDAIAEGIAVGKPMPDLVPNSMGDIYHDGITDPIDGWSRDPRLAYARLRNAINGAGAWEANPWVVAVSFTVGRHNIDAEASNA